MVSVDKVVLDVYAEDIVAYITVMLSVELSQTLSDYVCATIATTS